MAHSFGIRDEVRDDPQDIWLFDISYSSPALGKTYRVVGALLPLGRADIMPVPRTNEVEKQPRYKTLIALCLFAALAGAGAIAFLPNNFNSPSDYLAWSTQKKGPPIPPSN